MLPVSFVRQVRALALAVVLTIPGCASQDPWSDRDFSEPPPVDPTLLAEISAAKAGAGVTLAQRAQAGDANAQYELGLNYYYGIEVPEDRELSRLWMGRAAQQGHRQAAQVLASLKPAKPPNEGPAAGRDPDPRETTIDQERAGAEPGSPRAKPTPSSASGRSAVGAARSAAPDRTLLTGQWVRAQPGSSYTVQLLGGPDRRAIDRFASDHSVDGDLAVYRSHRNGADWYSVVLGSFQDRASAEQAKDALPPALRRAGPWVRTFGEIQAIQRD